MYECIHVYLYKRVKTIPFPIPLNEKLKPSTFDTEEKKSGSDSWLNCKNKTDLNSIKPFLTMRTTCFCYD